MQTNSAQVLTRITATRAVRPARQCATVTGSSSNGLRKGGAWSFTILKMTLVSKIIWPPASREKPSSCTRFCRIGGRRSEPRRQARIRWRRRLAESSRSFNLICQIQPASNVSAEIPNPLCSFFAISSVRGLLRFSTSDTRLGLPK